MKRASTKTSSHGRNLVLGPAIDISPLYDESWSECTSLLQDFSGSLARHGAVMLTGHGLSACKVRRAFEMSKEFFDLPAKRKESAAAVQCLGNYLSRGYLQGENDTQKTRVVETFVAGPPYDTHRPTRWPTGVLGEVLKMTLHALLRQCQRLHHDLLDILEVALDLRHDELTEQWMHQNGEVRIGHNLNPGQYHYASNSEEELLTLAFSGTDGEEIVIFCGPKLQEWTRAKLGVSGGDDENAVGPLSLEEYWHSPSSSGYLLSFVSFADWHASGSGLKKA